MSLVKFPECHGILFDFGGTLDSDGEHWLDRFFDLYRRVGLEFPQVAIKQAFYRAVASCENDFRIVSWGLRPLVRRLIDLQFASLDVENQPKRDEMVDLFCGKSERYLHRNAGLLRRWGSRLRLGLVSNFYGNVETVCNEHGLGVSLKVILDSARFGKKKPAPDIFQAALEQLELPPEQTLFVGDSYERDLMPARRLGMKTAWLRGPFPRLPADPEPVDVCLGTLTDLERMIS